MGRARHQLPRPSAGSSRRKGPGADGGPAFPGATIADAAGGGLQAALSIASALVRRNATGEGTFLDVSTADGVLHLMSLFVDEHLATGDEVAPGSALLTGKYACYDVYPARDGRWLAVGAIEGSVLREPVPRARVRALHRRPVRRRPPGRDPCGVPRGVRGTRDRDDWVAELAGKDTCVAPVLSIAEVARDAKPRGARIDRRRRASRARHVPSGRAGARRERPA